MLVGEAVEKYNVGWILGWPLVVFNVLRHESGDRREIKHA